MNIGANASALTEGLTEILLTVVTNYDHKYESASFTKSVRVKVIDPLNTDIPVNFNKEFAKPSLLLIPPHSNYRLKINKDISKVIKKNYINNSSLF